MIFQLKCKFNSIYKSKITNTQNKQSNHPTHDTILHIHAATNTQKENMTFTMTEFIPLSLLSWVSALSNCAVCKMNDLSC